MDKSVSVLNSGVSGLGSGPLTVPPFTEVHKWVPANLMLGGNPAMDWHPIQGEVEILLVTSCHGNRDKLWPDGPSGSNAETFFNIYVIYFA